MTTDIRQRIPIFMLRGCSIILDGDLAALYGVPTKRLNEQVKRNRERFPEDFMFEITRSELTVLRSQIATSKSQSIVIQEVKISKQGGRRSLPLAFTEHGALMVATVLNSPEAVAMSVYVVRAFVSMRELMVSNASILQRLSEVEKTLLQHDSTLYDLYLKLLPLLEPESPDTSRRRIGFDALPNENVT